jgi:hypothetical protein
LGPRKDRLAWRVAGFCLPAEGESVELDAFRIWVLIDEGWKLVIDEEGTLLAYLPPLVEERLESLGKRVRT